jgi:hypothetical protein
MVHRFLTASVLLVTLLGCSSEATVDTQGVDEASFKHSPAGVALLGFLDITYLLPTFLGNSAPDCVTLTSQGGTTSLTASGCSSSAGGTLAGKATYQDVTDGNGARTLTATFATLVATQTPTLQWTYAGSFTGTGDAANLAFRVEPGFTLTVADAGVPSITKAYAFTGTFQAATEGDTTTVQGAYRIDAGDQDAVAVTITQPLVFQKGSSAPVSGTLVISDARSGKEPAETATAVFSKGQVVINGGIIHP